MATDDWEHFVVSWCACRQRGHTRRRLLLPQPLLSTWSKQAFPPWGRSCVVQCILFARYTRHIHLPTPSLDLYGGHIHSPTPPLDLYGGQQEARGCCLLIFGGAVNSHPQLHSVPPRDKAASLHCFADVCCRSSADYLPCGAHLFNTPGARPTTEVSRGV